MKKIKLTHKSTKQKIASIITLVYFLLLLFFETTQNLTVYT